MKRYRVEVTHWHENSVGEEGYGPRLNKGVFDTRKEAEAEAARHRVPYTATGGGGGFKTDAYVREFETESRP